MTYNEEETFEVSSRFGKELNEGSIVCLYGDLGAGKTTFMKGLAFGAAHYPTDKISSPTFVYLNIYEGSKTLYHFDLYRLKNSKEFISAGFEDFLYAGGICCIEWPERIEDILPPHYSIYLKHLDQNSREITIFAA